MDTGKVEYAPDYKSKSQVRRIVAQQGNTLTRTDELIKEINERQRLEREVVEKAMARHCAETNFWEAAHRGGASVEDGLFHQANCDLRIATLALYDFESKLKTESRK